uniref:Acrosin-binding protein n=1 Tax=Dromaius novaehollandiae TaxID=8790 RepID=A0A8C4J9H4_DRONO
LESQFEISQPTLLRIYMLIPQGAKARQQGTPLSDREYRQFFRPLRAAHHASTACLIRALYSCQNPLIRGLDEYENHGVIPEGKTDHNFCGQAGRQTGVLRSQHWT